MEKDKNWEAITSNDSIENLDVWTTESNESTEWDASATTAWNATSSTVWNATQERL